MSDVEEFVAQVRSIVEQRVGAALDERRMFGAQAFFVGGNLACGASSRGLMVRVDRDEHDALLDAHPEASTMEMRGREMHGWMRVDTSSIGVDGLAAWVERGLAYAATLPAK